MDAITTDALTKTFDGETAVNGISLTVEDGEIFGLLGPNGAGKTTTINMLSTLQHVTSGTATVNGHDITTDRDAVRRSIGIVFQESALDEWLTGRENMGFHTRMYDLDKTTREQRIAELLRIVDLEDAADQQVKEYSGGMKRRLEIARGLLHHPDVLFLDEPTLGLDAETRRHIWEYIERLNEEEDVTIILTTHYMEEADHLCDRVAIMNHGNIAALDTPAALKDLLGGDVITIGLTTDSTAVEDAVTGLDAVKRVEHTGNQLSITVDHGERRIPQIIDVIEDAGEQIETVNLRKPSLEDVFLHLTGSTLDAQTPDSSPDRRR